MQIEYKSKSLEKVCTDFKEAQKKHGEEMAGLIHQRIYEIMASDSVETLVSCGIGRCHALTGDLAGKYAMKLKQPYRLIFAKKGDEIQIVKILDIKDYH